MLRFPLALDGDRRRVLAIGSHSDDIEIGCGATLLALTRAYPDLEVTWVVLGAQGVREDEARASAAAFLASAAWKAGRRPATPRRSPAARSRSRSERVDRVPVAQAATSSRSSSQVSPRKRRYCSARNRSATRSAGRSTSS